MHATKESNDFAVAPMGWALKVSRTPVRFSAKQKSYPTKRFELGEDLGLKADPGDVATDMRTTLDETGKRRFKNDELRRPQQIAGPDLLLGNAWQWIQLWPRENLRKLNQTTEGW